MAGETQTRVRPERDHVEKPRQPDAADLTPGRSPQPAGTVTNDVKTAVKEVKAGKVEFRTEKTAQVHVPVGKISFPAPNLVENAAALISAVRKAKPPAAKGRYVKAITLSSTMGPGIRIDTVHTDVVKH